MKEEERKKYQEELEAMKKKHKEHEPVSWKTEVYEQYFYFNLPPNEICTFAAASPR